MRCGAVRVEAKTNEGFYSSTPERLIGEGAEGLDQDLLTIAQVAKERRRG